MRLLRSLAAYLGALLDSVWANEVPSAEATPSSDTGMHIDPWG